MSHKTAKTVTNKFLNTTKSDREGVPKNLVALAMRGSIKVGNKNLVKRVEFEKYLAGKHFI